MAKKKNNDDETQEPTTVDKESYKAAWKSIVRHLQREGTHALGILRTGRRINWIETSHAYEMAGFESFEDWREKKLQLSPEWTRQYQKVGSSFTEPELKGKKLSVQAMVVIANSYKHFPKFREDLLELGQRHDASSIRKAIRQAAGKKNWKRILRQQLVRPPAERTPGQQPTKVFFSLSEHHTRTKRRLGSIIQEMRGVHERLTAGEDFPADDRFAMAADLQRTAHIMAQLADVLNGDAPISDLHIH